MSSQTPWELSSSFVNPKYIGLSPFFPCKSDRAQTNKITVLSSSYNFNLCIRRSLNTRIIGFGDPTLLQCINEFLLDIGLKSSTTEESISFVKRRCSMVNPYLLPWSPTPTYLSWLASENRLDTKSI